MTDNSVEPGASDEGSKEVVEEVSSEGAGPADCEEVTKSPKEGRKAAKPTPKLPLAPMFLPPQERRAAMKKRAAELEAAKVVAVAEISVSDKPRRDRKAKKKSMKAEEEGPQEGNQEGPLKGAKDSVRDKKDIKSKKAEDEGPQEGPLRGAKKGPLADKRNIEPMEAEDEGPRDGKEEDSSKDAAKKDPLGEKKNIPLAPMFAPKSERLRIAAEKKRESEAARKEAEEKVGRRRRTTRVSYVSDDASVEDDSPPPPPRRRKQVARAKPKARKKARPESESEYSVSEESTTSKPPPPPKVVLTEYSAAPLKVAGWAKSSGPVFGIFSGRTNASSRPPRSEALVEVKGVEPSPFCGSVNYDEDEGPSETLLWPRRPSRSLLEAPEMTTAHSSVEVASKTPIPPLPVIGDDESANPCSGERQLPWPKTRRVDIKEAVEAMMVPRDGRPWSAPLEPQDTHQWLAARVSPDRRSAHDDCKHYHKNWNRHHLLPPSARHKHALAKWLKLWVKRADTARDRRLMEAAPAPAAAGAPKRLRKASEAASASTNAVGAPEADEAGWVQKKGSRARTTGRRGLRRQMCYGCDGSVLVFEPPSRSRGKRGRHQSDTSDAEGILNGPTYTPFGCSVVITGDTGSGKTSLVYATAREAGVAVIELSVDSCPPGHTTQVGLRIEEAIKSGSVTVRGSQSSVASSASAELLPSPSPPEESSTTTGVLQLLLVDDVDAIIANDRSYGSLFGQLIAASRRPVVFTARSADELPRQLRPQPIRRREIIEFWDDLDTSPLLVQSSPQQLAIPRPTQQAVMAVALQLAEALHGTDLGASALPSPSSCTDFRRAALEVEAARKIPNPAADAEGGTSTLLSSSQLQEQQPTLEDLCSLTRLQSALAVAATPTVPQQRQESEVVEALRCLGGNLRVPNRECQATVIPLAMQMLGERDATGATTTRRSTRENATELFKMWTERQRVRMGPVANLKRCIAQEAIGVLLELRDRYPGLAVQDSSAETTSSCPSDTEMETVNSQATAANDDYPPSGD